MPENTPDQIQIDNKENHIIPVICQEKSNLRKSIGNNEDDMQRLVAYMNQFEKENISNAVVTNQHHSSLMSINQQTQLTSVQHQSNQQPDEKSIGNSAVDLPSIEEPSKLRLSSSSLSSYGDSLSNENNFEEQHVNQPESKTFESTGTIQISPNELNPMIVTTQNLNNLLKNSTCRPHEIDRRTYIVNKIYDNLDENVTETVNAQLKNDNLNEDDQYEKVILRHKDTNENNDEVLLSKKDEYDQKKVEPVEYQEEHIYVNVNKTVLKSKNKSSEKPSVLTHKEAESDETIKTPLIRESTGFDVTNTLKNLNHYENSSLFQSEILDKNKLNQLAKESSEHQVKQLSPNQKIDSENFDANFDTELVELNNQIEKLLTKNSEDSVKTEPLKDGKNTSNEPLQREVRTKSEGEEKNPTDVDSTNDSPMRRMTISSINFGENSDVIVTNNTNIKLPEKPPVTLRSKSITSKQNSVSKSVSNDEIQQRVVANNVQSTKPTETRASYKSKLESKKVGEEIVDSSSNDTNIKRKSALSSDEFKRRKSDNNQSESDAKAQTPKPGVVLPKNRQSLSTNTTPVIESDTTSNLKNANKKSMSKSLQDNSKLTNNNPNSSHQHPNKVSTVEDEKLSVKTKIKLMESIVKSSGNERSSSSSSSGSSSRSPPRSPKTIIEIVPVQSFLDKQKPPPVATTRTNLNQAQHLSKPSKFFANNSESTETTSIAKSLGSALPLKTSSNESLSEVSIKENVMFDTSEKVAKQPCAAPNSKEKRHTVKELMSKFEPK